MGILQAVRTIRPWERADKDLWLQQKMYIFLFYLCIYWWSANLGWKKKKKKKNLKKKKAFVNTKSNK